MACLTATLLLSASLQRIMPAIDFSFWTSWATLAVIFQKIFWSSRVVLGKRLVPCSNCRMTRTGVCFLRSTSKAMTTLTAISKISLAVLEDAWPRSRSLSGGTVLLRCGGTTCSKASLSSAGKLEPTCRKTATVLRSNSMAMRVLCPGRGPMVPNMGIMWKCIAQCVTMCSASSIFPSPVGPSMTTIPPSAKGLPDGAFALDPPSGMVWLTWWICRLKGPPSIFCTFTIPAHWLTLQSCSALALEEDTMSAPVTTEPSMGLSYHGKCIFFSLVKPTCVVVSLGTGLKMGIGFALPLTLIGAKAS
mmetsp:Transcript_2256/g.7118  ORF Transcript_2256/g.7118 Transcript_2256/m.7118 type:complete len:304 (-) Transcript_2256:64-975(-)